ncbi:hypothetical protein PV327_006435 [Microctonus hyperodae]|uniref:40S ribosomal protein S30 n=1 Tax=Microctonus hyperodae TaxID=165561 RepID=A0AA39F493_MICHY|nr:hypothetical protein PV327_006435 [Microctonus hyperodae]
MIEPRVCCYLFLLTFLESALLIRPSFHGHNNAFVQDENDVQYLLDNIPISMHKDFSSSVRGAGDATMDEKNVQDSIPYIRFEPNILDFKERQLGVPHQETVTLFNKDNNKTIHLSSISGSTQHFHSSFFQDKVIPPLGNTTFNVVFLGREEGEIDSHLYIHTSDGTLKYQVKGASISSPYRLRPVVGVKLPLNASFTPLIYMHNPHPEAMQVIEVYSSGGEFQLELPSGEAEGPRELWEIPPYQTKPIIRLHFNAYMEKNHTAKSVKMQLHIRGQETHVIDCQDNELIGNIKARLAVLENFGSLEFSLHCAGAPLSDETSVAELPCHTLELTVPLLGGKVHGSLARAGKVKGQTPKVEKQEKSKKKTGRAKRRIQYNRRFVTVVPTYGRRRGPNANPNT